jgi:hypothetical protein
MLAGIATYGLAAQESAAFPSTHRAAPGIEHRPTEEPLDFNGNEVRQAVARYKVDPAGELFEEHSPELEVPRLTPPKG